MSKLNMKVKINTPRYEALTECVRANGAFEYRNSVDGFESGFYKVVGAKLGEAGYMMFMMEKV